MYLKSILDSFKTSKSREWPIIDIKSGKMTYGQRLDLGAILSDKDKSEVELFDGVFMCLYNKVPAAHQFNKLLPIYQSILEGIVYWIEKENVMLKYDPTPEEKRAGIKELSEKVGDMGTLKALAKAYGTDPDEILKWEYGKVFGILYTDLEEAKYRRRYQEVIDRK